MRSPTTCAVLLMTVLGCYRPNDRYCTTDAACGPGQVCNQRTHDCEPGGGGDGGGRPPWWECEKESGCLPGLACLEHRCIACRRHTDCESLTCEVYANSPEGPGRCIAEQEVVYVDNRLGTCQGNHAGTKADPLCSIGEGVETLVAGRRAVRVMASTASYGGFMVRDRSASLYGPDEPGAVARVDNTVGTLSEGVSVWSFNTPIEVTVDGFAIAATRSTSGAVFCQPNVLGTLRLRRSSISSSGLGLNIGRCNLEMDRCLIHDNREAGLYLNNENELEWYSITNSVFARNPAPAGAVKFIGSGPITIKKRVFRYNTIVDNISAGRAQVRCLDGAFGPEISDSIILGNSLLMGKQIEGPCRVKNTVMGIRDTWPGGTPKDARFVDPANLDYRLIADNPLNQDCCIDKGLDPEGIRTDFLGVPRPLGARPDIGAHEAR